VEERQSQKRWLKKLISVETDLFQKFDQRCLDYYNLVTGRLGQKEDKVDVNWKRDGF